MPDESPAPVITTLAAEEARMRTVVVADIQAKARRGPAISPEKYREIFGGPAVQKLEAWEKELAAIEAAIEKDKNPRTNNHVNAKRQVAHWKKQVEQLTATHNG